MGIQRTGHSRAHAAVALALATLAFTMPARAETPQPPAEIVASESADVFVAPAEAAAPIADAGTSEPTFEPIGEGQASYYGRELAGNRTASGERFDPGALTAAHRTLPLGSRLRVTNKANGKSVIVRINDRGPFSRSRVIDISRGAAEEIAMVRSGTAMVSLDLMR